MSAPLRRVRAANAARESEAIVVAVWRGIAGKGGDKAETHKSGVSAGSRRIMRATADILFLFCRCMDIASGKGLRVRQKEEQERVRDLALVPLFRPHICHIYPSRSCRVLLAYTKLRDNQTSEQAKDSTPVRFVERSLDEKSRRQRGRSEDTPRSQRFSLPECRTVDYQAKRKFSSVREKLQCGGEASDSGQTTRLQVESGERFRQRFLRRLRRRSHVLEGTLWRVDG